MVVYPNYSRVPVDYYMERAPGAGIVQPMFPTPAWGQYFPGKVDGATMQVALTTQKTPAKRIWVVYRYAPPIPSSADGRYSPPPPATEHRLQKSISPTSAFSYT